MFFRCRPVISTRAHDGSEALELVNKLLTEETTYRPTARLHFVTSDLKLNDFTKTSSTYLSSATLLITA